MDTSNPLLVPLIALAGALGGALGAALINQLGNWLNEGRKLREQRQLAADAAVREYRKARALPIIEAVDRSVRALDQIEYFAEIGLWDRVETLVGQRREATYAFPTHAETVGVGNDQFFEALVAWRKAETDRYQAWIDVVAKVGRLRRRELKDESQPRYQSEALRKTRARFTVALDDFYRAAECYMFDINRPSERRRGLR